MDYLFPHCLNSFLHQTLPGSYLSLVDQLIKYSLNDTIIINTFQAIVSSFSSLSLLADRCYVRHQRRLHSRPRAKSNRIQSHPAILFEGYNQAGRK